jgi:predicted RNA-binding Zn-ribbon protein involved in translation (DUF1610 family)
MLMVTPAALALLRSETRAPVSLPRLKCLEPKARKLPKQRREAIVDRLVSMMREAEPTPFFVEGPGRAGIRSSLCEQGWRWGAADAVADEAIQSALARVGATRPSWKLGQPEFTQEAVLPILRECCARCGKQLPEDVHGRTKYCSAVCANAARVARREREDKEAARAKREIYDAAWAERQAPRACEVCGKSFRPKHRTSKYCSPSCGEDAWRASRRKVSVVRE